MSVVYSLPKETAAGAELFNCVGQSVLVLSLGVIMFVSFLNKTIDSCSGLICHFVGFHIQDECICKG